MDDDDHPREVWNEFQWEAFLKAQDEKTEKYFGLMEKYLDHPDRDALIAREMGWEDLGDTLWAEGDELDEDDLADEADDFTSSEEDMTDELHQAVFSHPAFENAMKVHHWIDEVINHHPGLSEHPLFANFVGRFATATAKLAGSLLQDDEEEIGMVIAFLKRGLKAANDSLHFLEDLKNQELLSEEEVIRVKMPLFSLREYLVDHMGQKRAEWQHRYGPNS